ncbi:MAG: helix-turn-helix domain-containing protein [Candidatus Acidiferrales bacterium]
MKKPTKTGRFASVSAPVSIGTLVERHFRMQEAALIVGVSRATLYRWLPQIRHRRVPAGGLTKHIVLIPESALAAFLARYEHTPEVRSVG